MMDIEQLRETLKDSSTFMVESEPEHHFKTVIKTLKELQSQGYTGVLMSFQRPFKSLENVFKKEDISQEKISVIDFATELEDRKEEDREKTVYLSPETNISEINRTIFKQIKKLEGPKKFLIMDSLDTPVLYRPREEVLKLSEFIVMMRNFQPELKIIFNTSKDSSENQFLRNVSRKMDRVVQ